MKNKLQSSAPYVGALLFLVGIAAVIGAVTVANTRPSTAANTPPSQTVGQATAGK
jgi:hypothetical protein